MEEKNKQEVRPVEPISRRQFSKLAGIASAAVGAGAAFGGALVACGGQTTTTTAGATTTTAGATTTTAAATTTSASAVATTAASGAQAGQPVKIGVVSPQTGALAVFAMADKWWVQHSKDAAGDGIVLGDGQKHAFEFTVLDTQSDSNRAAQVAGDLITNNKVDMVFSSGTPDTVNPAADQAEALGTPFLGDIEPWQAFTVGRKAPDAGFKWTYGFLLGSEQTMACFIDSFNQVPTNKVVGLVSANDADGAAFMNPQNGAPVAFKAAGFTTVIPAAYQPGAEDFTQQISEFKKAGCEILCGINNPPDFTNLWKQAYQQGFHPKLASSAKCLGWASVVEAIGPIGYNLLGEIGWHPTYPFKDSLTGMTCPQLAGRFRAEDGPAVGRPHVLLRALRVGRGRP